MSKTTRTTRSAPLKKHATKALRKTSRQLQAESTRKRLLESGRKLIAKRRLEDISIQEIATGANVSTGTFYLYFSSKEALLAEVLGNLETEERGFFNGDERETNQPLEKLLDYIDVHAKCAASRDVLFSQQLFANLGNEEFFNIYGYPPGNPSSGTFQGFCKCLERAKELGELSQDAPVHEMAILIGLLTIGLDAQDVMSSRSFDIVKRGKLIRRHIEEHIIGPYLV